MNTYLIFDFETGSTDTDNPCPIQLAACALDGDSIHLPMYEGGFFCEYMRPTSHTIRDGSISVRNLTDEEILDPDGPIKDGALYKNGIKREDILGYASEKVVWTNFVQFVLAHKKEGSLPIAVGSNIKSFDLAICDKLQLRHKTKRCFHENNYIDLMMLDWMVRHRDPAYTGKSFDMIGLHFGIPFEEGGQAHRADTDVKREAILFRRYMKWLWEGARKQDYFKDKCKEDKF